jgi:hypothetical protein
MCLNVPVVDKNVIIFNCGVYILLKKFNYDGTDFKL